jgi:hypothetical protein
MPNVLFLISEESSQLGLMYEGTDGLNCCIMIHQEMLKGRTTVSRKLMQHMPLFPSCSGFSFERYQKMKHSHLFGAAVNVHQAMIAK